MYGTGTVLLHDAGSKMDSIKVRGDGVSVALSLRLWSTRGPVVNVTLYLPAGLGSMYVATVLASRRRAGRCCGPMATNGGLESSPGEGTRLVEGDVLDGALAGKYSYDYSRCREKEGSEPNFADDRPDRGCAVCIVNE